MQRNIVKHLIKPRRLEFEKVSNNYGKFVVEPLERGYGTTLGNGLRRVLLSSLQGAAITAVKVDGVRHEFSTISGCVQDMAEVLLNLKQVVLDLGDKEEVELRLDVEGPCEVDAGMISSDPSVRVINPDKHIATLNAEGKLSMALTCRVGSGYVSAEEIKGEDAPAGTIALDASFSPVRKVNHFVTNARVGQRTDYDKLTVEVWTDGSIGAEDAIRTAAYVIREQMSVFCGVEEDEKVIEVEDRGESPKWNGNLFRRIDELELSVRSSNCLENADIKFIGELVQRSETEMLRTKNFGRKSLNEIKEILSEMGLSLGMRLDGFSSRQELESISEESATSMA